MFDNFLLFPFFFLWNTHDLYTFFFQGVQTKFQSDKWCWYLRIDIFIHRTNIDTLKEGIFTDDRKLKARDTKAGKKILQDI